MPIFKHFAVFTFVLLNINYVAAQDFNYAEVLQKSMWFYEVQRSGALPENNRVEWRGSSALKDGNDVGHDLTGGWYDAGDNMKFNFPMASSVTLLAWGGLEYPEGYRKNGQWGYLLSNIKWVTDYLIKCHTAPNEFYGQIGIGMVDHKFWGAPEIFPSERPAFKIDAQHPGSDLAAEAAAALASSSMLFKATDPAYASLLLKHAKELYDFADKYRGLYHEAITDVADFYKSWSGYQDELVWAALWLFIATEDATYLTKAESGYDLLAKEPQSTIPKYKEALSWDDKTYGCYVLLAKITNKTKYHTDAQRWLDWWTYGYSIRQTGGTSWSGDLGVAYTPDGLSWIRQWGPIRYSVNTVFAALVYSDCKDVPEKKKELYYNWAKSQIDYALGKNEQKRSYVCGYGVNPPVKPHHRSMHGPYLDKSSERPFNSRHVLYGALVGGPAQDGSYTDDRENAQTNEVATDYNAGFTSALARFAKDNSGTSLKDFPKPAVRDTEYTVSAKVNTPGNRFTEIAATVYNKTTWPARYSQDLTIRYFVNLSEVFNAGLKLSDVKVEFRNCTLCKSDLLVSPLKQYGSDTAIYYTEISFDGESIYPGGQSAYRREVQFRISLPDTAPQNIWDPTNDPSFNGLTKEMSDTLGDVNIPAYEKGVLVWGKEPDGTNFVVPVWKMPEFKEPPYNQSGWDQSVFNGIAVKKYSIVNKENSIYRITQGRGYLSVYALKKLKISFYSLNGKTIKSLIVDKGKKVNIDISDFASVSAVMQITSGNESFSQKIFGTIF